MATLGRNGGGLRLLAPGLTNAAAIAHAIVGAARAYGDDPVKAVTTPKGAGAAGRAGRSIAAAIAALSTQTGDRTHLARLFGRQPQTIRGAQASGRPAFAAAELAARSAVAAAQANARLTWSQETVALGEGMLEALQTGAVEILPPPEPEPVQSVVEPEPTPSAKPFHRDAGALSAHLRPPPITPRVVMPMGSLSERILTTLERGPRNTSSLALELDVKELLVGQCLSALRHEKRVRSDASFGLGRAMLWALVETAAA